MYAYIIGKITHISTDGCILENGGIGYNIRTAVFSKSGAPSMGDEVKFYTYFNVREDAQELFGFLDPEEIRIFKLLIGVSGVGPKGAMSILSVLDAQDLSFAVLSDDATAISKAPGIGRKTAQKVIIELKDKLDIEDTFQKAFDGGETDGAPAGESSARTDAILALNALGYGKAEVTAALRKVDITPDMDVEEIIKAALKEL
ncbi:MAG: Holliday junction branch migration protein RuvA [Eubacterium sp.]|nr:Holliday junction branch migration protein RuvA [Eubacterium sp.]